MSTQVHSIPAVFSDNRAAQSRAGALQAAAPAANAQAWSVLTVVGIGLGLIGWLDVAVGIVPFRLGNPDWEFGALGTAFDSMPLAMIGTATAAAAAIVSGRRVPLLLMAIVVTLMALGVAAALGLYGLSVPVVLKAVPPQMNRQILTAIIKTSMLGSIYFVLFIVAARSLWRALRAVRVRGSGSIK